MVAPLIAAGARTVGASVAKKTAQTTATRNGVRNVAVTNRGTRVVSNRARSAATTDEMFRDVRSNYSSVRNNQVINAQKRQAEENLESYEENNTYAQTRPDYQSKLKAQTKKQNSTSDAAASKTVGRIAVWISFSFLTLPIIFGLGLEVLGVAVMAGLASSVDWIPILGGKLTDGAIAVGALIFFVGYMILVMAQSTLTGILAYTRGSSLGHVVLTQAIMMVPFLHTVPWSFFTLTDGSNE